MTYAHTQSASPEPQSDAVEISEQLNHEVLRGLLAAVASIWQLEDQVAESCVQKRSRYSTLKEPSEFDSLSGGLAPWQVRRVKNT